MTPNPLTHRLQALAGMPTLKEMPNNNAPDLMKFLRWVFTKIENMDKSIGELRGEFYCNETIEEHYKHYKELERTFFLNTLEEPNHAKPTLM